MKNLSRHVTMIVWSYIYYGIYKKIESCYLAGWGFKGKSVALQRVLGLHLCGLPFSKSREFKYVLATCFVLFIAGFNLNAQNAMGVGTTTPNANAVLHLVSPTNNQGFLVPVYTTTQRTSSAFMENLSTTDNGLLIFDSDERSFYFWEDTEWSAVSAESGDMLQAIYDSDANGKIDTATVASSLAGYTIESSVPMGAIFTDNQTATDVTITSSGDLLATDVQGALDELQAEILSSGNGDMLQSTYDTNGDGYTDTAAVANTLNGFTIETSVPVNAVFTDSQTATDVAVAASGDLTSTDVQAALEELQTEISNAGNGDMLQSTYDSNGDGYADTAAVANTLNGFTVQTSVPVGAVFTDNQTAADVNVTPTGNLTSTDVQSALVELQSDIDAGASGGDMLQSVYDTNASGVVDAADSISINFIDGITLAYSVVASGLEVRDNGISTAKLANSSVTGAKIGITANEGDALVYTTGSWQAGQIPFTSISGVPAGLADGDDIGLTTVNTADIVDGAVTNIKLADGSVVNSKYAAGSITGDKIGVPASEGDALIYTTGSWQAGQIPFTSISGVPAGLADGDDVGITSVNTGDIVDGAVTDIKINDVDWSKISGVPAGLTDGDDIGLTTVNTADIIDGAVTNIKLADGSVGNSKYAAGSITGDKIGVPASEGDALIYTTGSWQAGQIPFTSISGVPAGLADGDDIGLTSVNTLDIVNDAVTATKIAADVAGAGLIQNVSGALDVDVASLVGSGLTNNGGVFQALVDNSTLGINGSSQIEVAPLGIGSAQLASDAIVSSKVLDGSIANADLDKTNIPLSGFGTPTANVSMGTFKITNLNTPTAAADAANKSYVDTQLAAIAQSQWLNGSGGDIYYNSGQVGIGTNTPTNPFHVLNNDASGIDAVNINHLSTANASSSAIYANADGSGTGNYTGGYFQASGSNGGQTGVYGFNTATSTGNKYGVRATTMGSSGTNYGMFTSASDAAINYGLYSDVYSSGTVNYAIYANAEIGSTNWAGYFNNGNVYIKDNLGIGTTPNTALEVAGQVSANDYVYRSGSEKSHILSLSGADFTSGENTLSFPTDFNAFYEVRFGTGNSEFLLRGGSAVAGTMGKMVAPIHLPQGATITQIEIYGRNLSTTNAMTINLIEANFSTTSSSYAIGTIPANIGASALQVNATGLTYVIDNSSFSYMLQINAEIGSLGITGIKVHYTKTSLD